MDQATMRDYIMHERLMEFGLEQGRWLELARHDMLTSALETHDPEFTAFPAFKVLLPIPQNEIDLNPNMAQNPGWSGG
jgi:hypothetical protein